MKNKKNAKSWLKTETKNRMYENRMYEMVSKTRAMIHIWSQISQCQMPKFGHFWPKICPKPSKILRITKKRCFHRVPRPKNVLCTNFQPKMMILIFWPVFGGPLDPGRRGGPISQAPQGSKGKSFQGIWRGPYRCEKSKKLAELF